MPEHFLPAQSAAGLFALIALAALLSENRRAINWRFVATAIALQFALAALFLKVPFVRDGLFALNVAVDALAAATRAGTSFVFGFVGGAPPPFDVKNPAGLFSLAFNALPLVIVVSALSAVLWHWRILPIIIRGLSSLLERTLGIGGAVGLASAANVFVGMIEAPLFIRGILKRLSRSEMMAVMSVGLATVSGTVLVLYAQTLEPVVPGAIGHILAASFISVPAALLIGAVLVPGRERTAEEPPEDRLAYQSSMDALARGTADGLQLYLGIIAMLIAVVALVALGNAILGALPDLWGAPITIERVFGWVFAPLVMLAGVPIAEAGTAGSLMGTKTILNEFLAYLSLATLPEGTLSPRTNLIMVYAMCGFANLGSVGMMVSALSALAPDRRGDIVSLGLKSLLAGTLATVMTGAVVGTLVWG